MVLGKGSCAGVRADGQGLSTCLEGLQEVLSSPAKGRQLTPVPKGQRGLGRAPHVGVWASLCSCSSKINSEGRFPNFLGLRGSGPSGHRKGRVRLEAVLGEWNPQTRPWGLCLLRTGSPQRVWRVDYVLVGLRSPWSDAGCLPGPLHSVWPAHFPLGWPALLPGALRRWWENRPTSSAAGAAGQRQSAPEAPLGPGVCLHRPGSMKCGPDSTQALGRL